MNRPLLIALFILAPLAGCGTSQSYKSLVSETYPVVATRMDRYPLTEDERQEVATLRRVAAPRKAVRYDTAAPAWEAVEPDYRRYVGEDAGLAEQRRADWLKTADLISEGQEAEREYRGSFFGR